MAFDDRFGDPKAQPRSHILLGREKGLEDALAIFGSDSWSIVFNSNFDVVTVIRFDTGYADLHPAVLVDGIRCIRDKIGNDLLQLSRPAMDWRTWCCVVLDGDVLSPELVREQRQHILDQLGYIELVGGARLAVKTERLPRDVRNAIKLLLSQREIVDCLLRNSRPQLRQEDQVVHRFQRIVDLVCNRRGETLSLEEFARISDLL